MITTGTKWFLGLGIVSFVLALAYGWTTGGNGLGPLTAGYNGGVGEHLGYGLLLSVAVISVALAAVVSATRDNSATAEAEVAGVNTLPPVAPATRSYWPPLTAFGVGLVIVGLVTEEIVTILGLVVLGLLIVEWTAQSWADHATGDQAVNRRLRNRVMNPFEVPVFGLLLCGVFFVTLSRVFLAVSSLGAVAVAGVGAALVLAVSAVIASRPKLSANLITGVVLAAAALTLVAGIGFGIVGERDFHEYEPAVTSEQVEDEVREEGL